MTKDVRNFDSEVPLVFQHYFYYRWAYQELFSYRETLNELDKRESHIKNSNKNIDQETLSSLILHETEDLHEIASKQATSALLFLCMTLEGFFNYYGTKRLSEEFFKRNVERIGITEKVALIILSCCKVRLDADNPIIVNTRKLFDERNKLVHPKTKGLRLNSLSSYVNIHPSEYVA